MSRTIAIKLCGPQLATSTLWFLGTPRTASRINVATSGRPLVMRCCLLGLSESQSPCRGGGVAGLATMTDVRVPAVAAAAAAAASWTRCSISFSVVVSEEEESVVIGVVAVAATTAGKGLVVGCSLPRNFSASVQVLGMGLLAAEEAEVLHIVAVRWCPGWLVPCSSACRCGMRSAGDTGARVT